MNINLIKTIEKLLEEGHVGKLFTCLSNFNKRCLYAPTTEIMMENALKGKLDGWINIHYRKVIISSLISKDVTGEYLSRIITEKIELLGYEIKRRIIDTLIEKDTTGEYLKDVVITGFNEEIELRQEDREYVISSLIEKDVTGEYLSRAIRFNKIWNVTFIDALIEKDTTGEYLKDLWLNFDKETPDVILFKVTNALIEKDITGEYLLYILNKIDFGYKHTYSKIKNILDIIFGIYKAVKPKVEEKNLYFIRSILKERILETF